MQLDELIRVNQRGRSFRELERDGGAESPVYQRLEQLSKRGPGKEFPTAGTLRALARMLDVSELTVVLAAAESLGLHTSNRPDVLDLFPPATRQLSTDQLKVVTAMIRSLAAS